MSRIGAAFQLLMPFVLTAAALPASAAIIYVDNISGDDQADGRARQVRSRTEGPVRTVSRAIQLANSTDVIFVAPSDVPYEECVVLDRPDLYGSPDLPFVIEGNGALLRATAVLPEHVWRYVGGGVYRYQPYRKGHYLLLVNGKPAEEVRVPPAGPPPKLEPMQWCAYHGWVYFRVQPRTFIDQYKIEVPCYQVGIMLHNARYVTVRNFRIEYYRLDGLHVSGNSRGVRLENIVSTGNGRAGLAVSGTSRVAAGGLKLEGNRLHDKLVLMKARLTNIPADQLSQLPHPHPFIDPLRAVRLRFFPDGTAIGLAVESKGPDKAKR